MKAQRITLVLVAVSIAILMLTGVGGLKATTNSSGWTQVASTGPSPRALVSMAFNPIRNRMVLFGGKNEVDPPLSDTWEWDGANWQQMATFGPTTTIGSLMFFDANRQRTLLLSYVVPDSDVQTYLLTWEWTGNLWSLINTAGPEARLFSVVTYDTVRNRGVLFGGWGIISTTQGFTLTLLSDTWEWDGSNWTRVSTVGPSSRVGHAMAYDPVRQRTVFFGGGHVMDNQIFNDTWTWNGNTWMQVASTDPSPRMFPAMTYDYNRNRIVLFGGGNFSGTINYGDTWEWDGVTWSQISSSGPAERQGHAMVYDPNINSVLLFGGADSTMSTTVYYNDTWTWGGPITDSCNINNTPIMLVPGMGGSEPLGLDYDNQLKFFKQWLVPHGYQSGCNLFYAANTSPDKTQVDNAMAIREDMCAARSQYKQLNTNWNGHFNIIGHSYGGLRAREYLETPWLYEQPCVNGDPTSKVYVDHLFTLGSPHLGEWGNLPLADGILLLSMGNFGSPAIWELLPPVRLLANDSHRQPSGTCYHLIGGNVALQPTALSVLEYLLLPGITLVPNDLAVHQDSALGLRNILHPLYTVWYPKVETNGTPDLHGDLRQYLPGTGSLRSYVSPDTTTESLIVPWLNRTDCGSIQTSMQVQVKQTEEATLSQPAIVVASGVITSNQVITGNYNATWSGDSLIKLSWLEGSIVLELQDPNDIVYKSGITQINPNASYFELNIGMGAMAGYMITDTITGTWNYTITTGSLAQPTPYSLVVYPSTPIAVQGYAPDWLEFGTTVPLTASVTYSTTTAVTGGVVTAQIFRPDGIKDTLTLFDDGLRGDGSANDGVFGAFYSNTNSGGYYGVEFRASGLYSGENYVRTNNAVFAVATGHAKFAGKYTDQPVEPTSGQYSALDITAQLTVTQPSTYTLSGDLVAGDGTYVGHALTTTILSTDTQSVTLPFDGKDIYISGKDGPYILTNLLLVENQGMDLLLQKADAIYTTAYYRYRQFGPLWTIYLPLVIRN